MYLDDPQDLLPTPAHPPLLSGIFKHKEDKKVPYLNSNFPHDEEIFTKLNKTPKPWNRVKWELL